MRLTDRRCPKCDNFRDVRADFCTQPRHSSAIICNLAVGDKKTGHQHFRCKQCKYHWVELIQVRGLNI